MEFVGGQLGHLNEITLQLGSTNTCYKLIMQPFDPDDHGFRVKSTAAILFRDSRELDTFIYMLQKFRAKNHDYIGDWMEVKNDRSPTDI